MPIAALVGLLAASVQERPFADDRALLDRRLEALRRVLPDAPNPVADAAHVRELVESARLQAADVLARPPLETAEKGDVAVDVTATGRFGDVDRFFRQVALSPRLLDVERLTLSATPSGLVRLVAVVHLPYRTQRAALPAPPEAPRPTGAPRGQMEQYLRDQALLLAKTEQIAALRRARRNPRLFLSELAAVVRDRPVSLSHASLADEFTVRGLIIGEGPTRDLERRFERGFFRVTDFLMARLGGCRRFEARGTAPIAGPDAELPLPADDPFEQNELPCRVDRDPPQRSVVVRPAKEKAAPGGGPLTLRLRDVDMADVFGVLHRLTAATFVVDGDVTGRMSIDLARVTLEEVLALIEKQTGVRTVDLGRVKRVFSSRQGSGRAGAPPMGGGAAASFSLKRAGVRDVLAVMTDIDPTLAALGPDGSLGQVSVWAQDVPVAELRAAILEASQLEERNEDGRRILSRAGTNEASVQPVASGLSDPRLALRPQDLVVAEFELAGVAANGESWLSVAYAPTGALHVYRAGDKLLDAAVTAVNSTDVLLDTDDGPLRLPLSTLR